MVGSLISAVPNALIARSRDRRDEDRERRRDDAETRLACRLVAQELAEAAQLVEHTAKTHRFWPGLRELPSETWERYKVTLAAAVDSPADWRCLIDAYDALNGVNWTLRERRWVAVTVESRMEGEPLLPGDELATAWLVLRYATRILEHIAGDQITAKDDDLKRFKQLWPENSSEHPGTLADDRERT